MDIYAKRRELLLKLIDTKFNGTIAKFADAVDLAPSYVTRLTYEPAKSGAVNIGEKVAHKIETALNIQGYFFNNDYSLIKELDTAPTQDYIAIKKYDVVAGMGLEYFNNDYPDIIENIFFNKEYIRSVLGFLPMVKERNRLALITVRGDSMLPTINNNNFVLIDTKINAYQGDGLYALAFASGGLQVKRLVCREAVYVVSDNKEKYDPFLLPDNAKIAGKAFLLANFAHV